MKSIKRLLLVVPIVALTLGTAGLVVAQAATQINLVAADNFVVLAGSTVTNIGSSVINGDLGLAPGTSVTGFPAGVINCTQYVANTNATNAQTDLTAAYTNAMNQTPVSTIPTELGGTTQVAGIYDSSAGTFSITGTLTLDAQGNDNAVFIFKTASTLITDSASNVNLINGAQACNIFWVVGSSATLGSGSNFRGNILAFSSITLNTGVNVTGRVLARNGAVTLDSNTITKAVCAVPAPVITPIPVIVTPISTPTTTPVIVTPVPVLISEPVVVATKTPTLPATGVAPGNNTPWNIIIPAGVLSLAALYVARRKLVA
jgi:hypothetical protein